MDHEANHGTRRDSALRLLRDLRQVDAKVGVKNSRIAFDVAQMCYEAAIALPPAPLSVDQIAAASGYSGPTVRLVVKRLIEAGTVEASHRVGKTQLYALTPEGRLAFEGYLTAILDFKA